MQDGRVLKQIDQETMEVATPLGLSVEALLTILGEKVLQYQTEA